MKKKIHLGRDHARRIQRVAYLLIVHGVLEILTCGMSAIWLRTRTYPDPHPGFPWPYLALPAAAALGGTLKLAAGLAAQRYRGRGLGMAALLSAPLAAGTIVCLPTAVLLSAYGLWVYSHPKVRRAFALGTAGTPPAEVESALRGKET